MAPPATPHATRRQGRGSRRMSVSGRRRIVLCADDYGISPAVSAAIRDLIARRRINATSAMVVAPSFSNTEADRAARAAADHAAIGLHLTLTAPFRPLTAASRRLRDGAFLPLSAMAGRGLGRMLTPALLEAEIAAQIAAFRSPSAARPTYIDGHQHIHVFPQIGEALIRVAGESAARLAAPMRPRGAAQSRTERADPGCLEQTLQAPCGANRPPHQSGLRRHL